MKSKEMTHSPLAQFDIKKLIDIKMFGFDVSFTNSSIYMLLASILALTYFYLAFYNRKLVPSRLQVSAEIVYNLVADMLNQIIGVKGRKFIPLIFSLFIFILFCNLLGMTPYSFTTTSHIIVNFTLEILVVLMVTIVGFVKHGLRFLTLFLPHGTPLWLAPLMIVIELFTYFARPVSLSLRLAANMMAGHVLFKVIAGFTVSLMIYLKFLPIPIMVILIGFEIFVQYLKLIFLLFYLVCILMMLLIYTRLFAQLASKGNLYVNPMLESSCTFLYSAVLCYVFPANSSLLASLCKKPIIKIIR